MAGTETAAPSVFIWVRSAIDWADEAVFVSQVKPGFLPKLERWNETFTMPYHRFRHEVCEIARLSLARVARAAVRPWDEIPDGAIVLPSDDDDWFAPDIVALLEARRDEEATGYLWSPRYLEVPVGIRHRVDLTRQRLNPRTPPRYLCATNGYAFVKQPGTESIGRSHMHASVVFEQESGRVRRIDGRPSIVNRTLASQTTLFHLRPAISRRRLLAKYGAYRRLYRGSCLSGVDWAEEYVARMALLMDRLEVRASR